MLNIYSYLIGKLSVENSFTLAKHDNISCYDVDLGNFLGCVYVASRILFITYTHFYYHQLQNVRPAKCIIYFVFRV